MSVDSTRTRITKRTRSRARHGSPAIKIENDTAALASRRRSARSKRPRANLPTPPRSPPASISPTAAVPPLAHTTSSSSCNSRRTAPVNTSYTSPAADLPTTCDDSRQPTVNWDCVSYVVSDQKIQTTYEKPDFAPDILSTSGEPIPGTARVRSYGKMITKTITLTQTTTIATTEILHPEEPGYEESVRRQQHQAEASPEERERIERQYQESRSWSAGNRTRHEHFHYGHHRAAQPASANSVSACVASA